MVKDFAGAEERALLVLVQEVLKETSSKKVLDQVQGIGITRVCGSIWLDQVQQRQYRLSHSHNSTAPA